VNYCGSVVIPHFGHDSEFPQARIRNDTEISDFDSNACHEAMRQPVQSIEKCERDSLGTARSLGEHNASFAIRLKSFEKTRNVGGTIFAVRVHHDDGTTRTLRRDVAESDRQSALVSNVSCQRQNVD
jgi:hypothetical protein